MQSCNISLIFSFSFFSSDYFYSKPSFTQILVASSIGLIIAVAVHYRIRKLWGDKLVPRLILSDTRRVEKLERFPHYVGNYVIWSFQYTFGSIYVNVLLFMLSFPGQFHSCLHPHNVTLWKPKDQTSLDINISLNIFNLCFNSVSPLVAARQMGFKDRRECPQLCKLASEYLRKYEGCEDDIYTFFASEPDADSLFVKLVEEFERCILSYFAFHWSLTDLMISQVSKI